MEHRSTHRNPQAPSARLCMIQVAGSAAAPRAATASVPTMKADSSSDAAARTGQGRGVGGGGVQVSIERHYEV